MTLQNVDFLAFFHILQIFTMKHWNIILNKLNTKNQESRTFIQSMIGFACNIINFFIIISIVINKLLVTSLYTIVSKYVKNFILPHIHYIHI